MPHANACVLALLAVSGSLAASAGSASPPPVAVFAELEGTWEGTFVGYNPSGVELYRIAVTQTYETVDETTQTVVIVDRMPDGTVVRGTGKNVARRTPGGELEISCAVDKSNGDRVRHRGRQVRGPLGTEELVWYSAGEGRSETFQEDVIDDGSGPVYVIHGMGQYGGARILMAGRYRKVKR